MAKKRMAVLVDCRCFDNKPELKEGLQKFIEANYQYFFNQSFFEQELTELDRLIQESWNGIYSFIFTQFKTITEDQAMLQQEWKAKKNIKEQATGNF
jgi:hypothetical protein